MGRLSRLFLAAVAAQLVIFLLSLPGLGIETRRPSDYAAWAGPIFLVLTLLVFLFGVVALALARSRPSRARGLGVGQALGALALNALDLSHVGGPPPPNGPLVLGVLSILVALVTLATVGRSD